MRLTRPPTDPRLLAHEHDRVLSPSRVCRGARVTGAPRTCAPRHGSARDPPARPCCAPRTPPAHGAPPPASNACPRIAQQDVTPAIPCPAQPGGRARRGGLLVPAVTCQHEIDVGRLLVQQVHGQDPHAQVVGTDVELDRGDGVSVDVHRGDGLRARLTGRDGAEPRFREPRSSTRRFAATSGWSWR